jgi:hypothetical protein
LGFLNRNFCFTQTGHHFHLLRTDLDAITARLHWPHGSELHFYIHIRLTTWQFTINGSPMNDENPEFLTPQLQQLNFCIAAKSNVIAVIQLDLSPGITSCLD